MGLVLRSCSIRVCLGPSEMLSSRRLGTVGGRLLPRSAGRGRIEELQSRCRPTRRTLTLQHAWNHRPPAGHDYLASSRPRPVSRQGRRISSRRGSGKFKEAVKNLRKPSSCGRVPEAWNNLSVPSSSCNRGMRRSSSPECAQDAAMPRRVGARQPGWAYYQKKDVRVREGVARGSQPRTGFCVAATVLPRFTWTVANPTKRWTRWPRGL